MKPEASVGASWSQTIWDRDELIGSDPYLCGLPPCSIPCMVDVVSKWIEYSEALLHGAGTHGFCLCLNNGTSAPGVDVSLVFSGRLTTRLHAHTY